MFELPDETASKVYVLAKKMSTVMKEKFGADGFNIVQNNAECAGQTVFHFHMHLIPRYDSEFIIHSRIFLSFSPIPPVNTIASTPLSAAT